jgi:MYXO-CTERM domain-containing protein
MQAIKYLGMAAIALCGAAAHALDIQFDYSLDTKNVFGPDKRRVLDQVASIFEHNLGNHLAALSNVKFSVVMSYPDPILESKLVVTDLDVPADTLVVYVAAGDLMGSTVGLSWTDTADPTRTGTNFNSGWGGELMFDTTQDLSGYGSAYAGKTMARNWYVDDDIRSAEAQTYTKLPKNPASPNGAYYELKDLDFATVAMHEMGHMFGLGHSSDPGDTMYAGAPWRHLFSADDWNAMSAEGWQVLSVNPNLDVVVSVPEVSSQAMLAAGLLGVGWFARRRRR